MGRGPILDILFFRHYWAKLSGQIFTKHMRYWLQIYFYIFLDVLPKNSQKDEICRKFAKLGKKVQYWTSANASELFSKRKIWPYKKFEKTNENWVQVTISVPNPVLKWVIFYLPIYLPILLSPSHTMNFQEKLRKPSWHLDNLALEIVIRFGK